MIFSNVYKESEHEGTQKLMVKGSYIEIATELSNIVKEVLKRGFPEELLLSSIFEAVEDYHNSRRV